LVLAAKESLSRHVKNYRYKDLVDCERGKLDIRVSKDNIGRALKIFDTLIKAAKLRGHKIEIRYDNTYIVVLGQSIEVKLREQTKRIPSKDTGDLVNTLRRESCILKLVMAIMRSISKTENNQLKCSYH